MGCRDVISQETCTLGILDSVIRPAHLSALAQHPLLASTLEVLLPHVGSPPLWEHPASIPKSSPQKQSQLTFGDWGLYFWESRPAQSP